MKPQQVTQRPAAGDVLAKVRAQSESAPEPPRVGAEADDDAEDQPLQTTGDDDASDDDEGEADEGEAEGDSDDLRDDGSDEDA